MLKLATPQVRLFTSFNFACTNELHSIVRMFTDLLVDNFMFIQTWIHT